MVVLNSVGDSQSETFRTYLSGGGQIGYGTEPSPDTAGDLQPTNPILRVILSNSGVFFPCRHRSYLHRIISSDYLLLDLGYLAN